MYTLSKKIGHLVKFEVSQIKFIGASISDSFDGLQSLNMDMLHEVFQCEEHMQFFFYEYDKYKSLLHRLEKCKLTFEQKGSSDDLNAKVTKLTEKIAEVEKSALIRFKSKSYCKRKILSLVQREALYIAQSNKRIGGDSKESIASIDMVDLKKRQNDYNQKLLSKKGIYIDGELIPLSKFAKTKQKKAAELYSKTKGFEKLAQEKGFGWAFLTMTAPAKFHANPVSSQHNRAKWTREKVTGAHSYLRACWAALGKQIADDGHPMKAGHLFGVRVVEPHKDGTPHWHMLVFFDPQLEDYLFSSSCGLFQKHFQHSPHAFKVNMGISSTGKNVASASSYIFKYILKSIGGEFLGDELHISNGNLEIEKIQNDANKISAWKSAVNIKMYHQFGVHGTSELWGVARKISAKTGRLRSDKDSKLYSLSYDNEINKNGCIPNDFFKGYFEKSLEQFNDYINSLDTEYKLYELSSSRFSVDKECLEIDESWKIGLDNQIVDFIECNGSLSDFELMNLECNAYKLIDFSVRNDYSSFLKISALNYSYLVKEKYINSYDECKYRTIGFNFGSHIYYLDRYKIIEMTVANH
ncbi:replication endonuclease [Vibrio splendidus]|uniref:replication endonuclease n=1 Tax=Vibrio splendidus TaxID=29497 RepID=UPI000C823763|nr:replication endonuclease [Vibrio splendidus]PMG54915.1 hypothetical protein BCU89_14585 [Vibrio splendidus]